ncbi:helix-turn-helix domain-containing protein [Actinomadura vinacea]|uniref:PucR family transcriptional regulator n=1 Tax=Actinomadura vinacea TaxID=115336 RepID=UPI0031E35DD4
MPTAPPLTDAVRRDTGALRPHIEAAAAEMVLEIQRQVPEYACPPGSRFSRRMHWAVNQTVAHFVEALAGGRPDWRALTDIYVEVGAYEARKGRSLDGLQSAVRVAGQVACRRFISETRRLEWSLETLGQITESLFAFLERVAGAASRGYAEATERLATERERLRWRLRDLLIADPPASDEAIGELARPAGWGKPRTIAVVAVRRPAGRPVPVLPPHVLADWHCAEPYLIVPDPEGPGQDGFLESLPAGYRAAIGPTVPPAAGALSLRWARRTLALAEDGTVPGEGVARCMDHLPAVIISMSRELLAFAVRERLRPLDELPPHRRALFARTLLEYMKCHDNAVDAAERLMVHDQTVRYRVRRLKQLLGDDVNDPRHRTELLLLLNAAVEFDLIDDPMERPETERG